MSSWLGGMQWGSLPNKISTFAKEVLTEAEEEVTDPVAELKVARSKIEELEKSVQSYTKEWERIKQRNDELSDRSESAEYQIAAISQEYRKLLQSKEEEIKQLKSDKLRLTELSHLVPPGDMFLSSETGEIPKATSSSLLMAEEGMIEMNLGSDSYDGETWLGGVVPQQQEVARLQEEVGYLKEQCEHWKKMAEGCVPAGEESEALLLRKEVEQLRKEVEHQHESLRTMSDQHSHELTSLQQLHEERLQVLRDASTQKTEELQKRIAELEQTQTQTTIETGNGISSMEREKERLLAEVDNLEGRIREEQQAAHRLKAEHLAQQEQAESLSQHIRSLSEQLDEKTTEVATLQSQYDHTQERCNTLQTTLDHTEAANCSIREESAGLQRSVSALRNQLMESVALKQRVREELVQLCSQVSEAKLSLSSAKESASSMMAKLRQEMVGGVSAITAHQQATLEVYHKKEAELLSDVEFLKKQNHSLSLRLEEANHNDEGDQKGEGTAPAVEKLACEVRELKELLESERISKKRLQDHLAQLVADHDAELSELVEERDKLQESLHEMETASEKSHAAKEDDGSIWNTSDGWNEWGMEEVSTTTQLKKVHETPTSTEQAANTKKLTHETLKQSQEQALQAVEDITSWLGMPQGGDVCSGVEDLLKQKGELEEQISDMRKEIESLRAGTFVGQAQGQQLEEVQQAHDNVHATLLQREAQLTSVSQQLADAEEKNVILKAEAEEVHQTVEEKTAICTTLEQKVVDLSASLEEARNEAQATLGKLQSLQASQQQDHSTAEQLAEAQMTVAHLQETLSEKEAAVSGILHECDALTVSQTEMASAYNKASQDVSELQAEVDNLREELLKMTQALKEGQSQMDRQHVEIAGLQTALQEAKGEIGSLRETASTLESNLSECTQLVQVKEETIRALTADRDGREEMLRGAAHQEEQVKTKLQNNVSQLEADLSRAKEELTAAQQQCGSIPHLKAKLAEKEGEIQSGHQEMDTLREALSAVAEEKLTLVNRFAALEGELQAVKSKGEEHQQRASSLQQQLLQVQDARSSSSMVIEAKYSALEAERDQIIGTLNDVGRENGQLKKTVAELKERQQKTAEKHTEELERLRQHLLQVDGHYTQEALKAEEREVVLRQRLAQLEEEARRTAEVDITNIHQRDQQLTSLQQQLQALSLQRDDAVLNLSTTQEDLEQTQHELGNLQLVLEQFQRDRVTEVNLTLEHTQHELERVEREKEEMGEELQRLQTELQETSLSLGNVSAIGQELEMKEKQLQQQVDNLQTTLNTSQLKLKQLTNQEGERVDKSLVKNLIHGYLTAPDRKKGEVLRLIASILGFSEQDVGQAVSPRGWLSGWFGGSNPQSPTSRDASFTEMFVTFLENEAGKSRSSAQLSGNLSPSYVDPQTDPDRPSLSTASTRPANTTNPRPPPISSREPVSAVTPSFSASGVPALTIPITTHGQLSTTGSIVSAETGSGRHTGSSYAAGSVPSVSLLPSGELPLGSQETHTNELVTQVPAAIGSLPQVPHLSTGSSVHKSSTSQTSLLKDILSN